MVMQFLGIFFTHTSAYIIALIGFDRYARVKFLTRYSEVMKEGRVKKAVVGMVLLSFIQGAIYVIGTLLEIFKKIKQVAIAIDIIIILLVVISTIMGVRAVRKHRKNIENQSMMEDVDKTMTSLASKILLTIVIFYIVYIVIVVVHTLQAKNASAVTRGWLEFALFIGYLLAYTNSLVNALIFLSFNNKTQNTLREFAIRYRRRQIGISSNCEINVSIDVSQHNISDQQL